MLNKEFWIFNINIYLFRYFRRWDLISIACGQNIFIFIFWSLSISFCQLTWTFRNSFKISTIELTKNNQPNKIKQKHFFDIMIWTN